METKQAEQTDPQPLSASETPAETLFSSPPHFTQVSQPKSHKTRILLLVLALFVATGVAGYVALQNGELKQQANLVETGNTQEETLPTIDGPTEGWQVYQDQKYGYTIRYPTEWFIHPIDPSAFHGVTSLANYDFNAEDGEHPPSITKLEIQILDLDTVVSLNSFVEQRLQEYKDSPYVANPVLKSQADVQIGNLLTQQISMTDNRDNKLIKEYISSTNNYLIIVAHYDTAQKFNIVPQILSTFRFTTNAFNSTETKIFSGTLQSIDRPAPDIPYDFKLALDTPYFDELNAQGPTNITTIVVVPEDETIHRTLAANVGNSVSIEGVIEWGLAETRHLKANKIVVMPNN